MRHYIRVPLHKVPWIPKRRLRRGTVVEGDGKVIAQGCLEDRPVMRIPVLTINDERKKDLNDLRMFRDSIDLAGGDVGIVSDNVHRAKNSPVLLQPILYLPIIVRCRKSGSVLVTG